MKKFLCYTSLFTLIVLTVLAAFERSLRRIPTLYTATHQALTERAPQLHTLIMGSSVAKDGINALLLDSTGRAYNMAMPGEQVTYGYLKFCHYAERMPQLRDVVWGLAFYNLFQDDRTDVDASKRAGHQAVADAATRVAALRHSLRCLSAARGGRHPQRHSEPPQGRVCHRLHARRALHRRRLLRP